MAARWSIANPLIVAPTAGALSAQDVREKFNGNVRGRLSDQQAERVWEAVIGLDGAADLRELNEALAVG